MKSSEPGLGNLMSDLMGGGGGGGGGGLAGMMNAWAAYGRRWRRLSRNDEQYGRRHGRWHGRRHGRRTIKRKCRVRQTSDDILRNVESKPEVQPASGFASSQAEPQINLDDAMNFGESDLDQAKGVKIKKNRRKNGKKEVYIDF